jgi:hypothetical protein
LPSVLAVGASVRIKEGVTDPDSKQAISGWQGRVVEVTRKSVLIEWDSLTLKAMPEQMIEWCEEEGLDWSQMGLAVNEVEIAPARDMEADVQKVKRALGRKHAWAYLGPEGKRIQKVLAGVERDDDLIAFRVWRVYLRENLKFPFDAVVSEYQDRGPLHTGDRVRVRDLHSVIDDLYGLIAKIRSGRGATAFPLCDLEVVEKQSPNYQMVRDYAVWFANR